MSAPQAEADPAEALPVADPGVAESVSPTPEVAQLPAETAHETAAPAAGALPELEELEELVEPAGGAATALVSGDMVTTPDGGELEVVRPLRTERGVEVYELRPPGGEGEARLCLRTGTEAAAAQVRQEAELLAALASPAFPAVVASWESEGRAYLITEASPEPTLAEALSGEGLPLPRLLSVFAQVAHALARLHAAGWVHLGVRPSAVYLSRPVQLGDLAYAAPVGQKPGFSFYHAGYSPPELLGDGPVDERADIYAVGALLFHAVTGRAIAETGAELTSWEPATPIGGVPQILHRCLGAPETRYSTMAELHADLLRLVRRHAPVVHHRIAAATSIGLEPTRRANQDAYSYLTGGVESEEGPQTWSLLCVSDGMGGMEAGEAASEAAVRRIVTEAAGFFRPGKEPSAEEQLRAVRDWMQKANASAVDALEARRARGGATLVCASVLGRRLALAHVGDCRLYLLRGEELTLLTRDHSLVMAMVTQGQITMDEIRSHPDRSTVTRSLGDRAPLPEYQIDTLEQVTGKPVMELEAGDRLLLCSDGLWEPVVEEEMTRVLLEHPENLDAAARELVRLALERGGPDNIAVLLFRLDRTPVQENLLLPARGSERC